MEILLRRWPVYTLAVHSLQNVENADGNDEFSPSEGEFIKGRQIYRLDRAQAAHEGRYTCIAENKVGRAEKVMVVTVLPPPVISPGRTVVEVKENDTTTLDCPVENALGIGAQILWNRNGVSIAASENLQVSGNGAKLHIIHAQQSDAGHYTCVAQNEAGQTSLDIRVITLVLPRVLGDSFRTMEALVNSTVTLDCMATGIPEPKVDWYKDGRPLIIDDRVELINGSILRMHMTNALDQGRYSCVAVNKVGRDEADIFLSLIQPPVVLSHENELKVILNQPQTIRCEVNGSPQPVVTWLKDGHPYEAPMAHSSSNFHYIHIVSAQREDAGRYSCVATNKGGQTRHLVRLEVLVPPSIQSGDRVLSVIENQTVSIGCDASGSPEPEVVWSKDGVPLIFTDRHRQERGRLHIESVKTEDVGRYSCEATNEAGSVDADFALDVYVKPYFEELHHVVRVVEGERATVECDVKAKPSPTIQWLKGGRPLDPTQLGFILSPHGRRIMILNAKRGDAGTYSCVARNLAGEVNANFEVIVLVAPYMVEQIDQNPQIVLGHDVLIQCPILGIPPPLVTWMKEGNPVLHDDRVMMESEHHLRIKNVNIGDEGRYTCRAENDAGSLNTDYALRVIGPPKFGNVGGEAKEYEVLLEGTITMTCEVEAQPKPTITWLRGDKAVYLDTNVWLSGDDRQLTISNAQLEDGGRYSCRATNQAGSAELAIILHVLVPPSIDKSNIIGNPLAIVERTITLECPASGIPPPAVQWLKSGAPLIADDPRISFDYNNQTLKIERVQTEDEGRYTCIARSKAGQSEQDFNMEVLTPPRMESSGAVNVTVEEGERLVLTCPVSRERVNPTPDISWSKDGRPIRPLSVPNVRFDSDQRRVSFPSAQPSDGGVYQCMAINRAGESTLLFHVTVLSPPTIDATRNDVRPYVVEGRSVTLWCIVRGNPPPRIQWLRNGKEITEDMTDYLIQDNGQALSVKDARPEHSAEYRCIVENDVGRKEFVMPLDIWTAPEVTLEGPKSAELETAISLTCHVTGNPTPTIQWFHNGQPLLASLRGPRFSLDGAKMDIGSVSEQDGGQYSCSAQNEAGSAEGQISIDILIPPKIRSHGVDTNPAVTVGRTLTLVCDASGRPPPNIYWFKGDDEINVATDSHYTVPTAGYLQIENIQVNNRGIYRCVATNEAGKDELQYTLDIVEEPEISSVGGTVQVVEGETAELFCNARGTPLPRIIWQRNGQSISNEGRYQVIDKTLRISNTRSLDAGIYVCLAESTVGTAQQAYTLEVLVPPSIVDGAPEFITVPVGQEFSLYCAARGYPDPARVWEKDATLISPSENHYMVDLDGTLSVSSSVVADSGRYRCIVKNPAGQSEKIYQVEIIPPPTIDTDSLVVINVTEKSPAVMSCGVQKDIKDQTVTWYKSDTQLSIFTNPSMSLGEQGTELRIGETGLLDEGDYKCTAQNPAGNATRRFRLNVFKPPSIADMPDSLVVNAGERADLLCEAVGKPMPDVIWQVRGQPIDLSLRNGNSLIFQQAESSHSGVYTCLARNWAGVVSREIRLVVTVPPKIVPERMNMSVHVNNSATLPCDASGIPTPIVEWFRQPNIRILPGAKYQIIGNNLRIFDVNSEDEDVYRCVATNRAGVAIGLRKLGVDAPRLGKIVWVVCDEYGRPALERHTTYVRPRGDVPADDDTLLPYEETPTLPVNGSNGVFLRCIPNRERGQRSEIAPWSKPIVAEVPLNQDIEAGSTLEMVCSAVGTPEPMIVWMRDGRTIPGQSPSLNGRSVLRILDAQEHHSGTYVCVARNAAGSTQVAATVNVRESHRATSGKLSAERSVALLSCWVRPSMPGSDTIWTKETGTLEAFDMDNTRILANGSLVIIDYQTRADLDAYTCTVGKKRGTIQVYEVIVKEVEPLVSVRPGSAVVESGETVVLECFHSASPLTTTIMWVGKDGPLLQTDHIHIDNQNRLLIKSITAEHAGTYKCRATNSIGDGYGEATVVVQSEGYLSSLPGRWSSWTEYSRCNRQCAPSYQTRFRTCFDTSSGLPLDAGLCRGEAYETLPCIDLPPCERPEKSYGELRGSINGISVNGTPVAARLLPGGSGNRIRVEIEPLSVHIKPVEKTMLGMLTSPCWATAYPVGIDLDKNGLAGGKYRHSSEYNFETGQNLRYQEVSKGGDANGYLTIDVLVDGSVPNVNSQQRFVHVSAFKENLVRTSPGHLYGFGNAQLDVDDKYHIPFSWHRNISFEEDIELPIPPSREIEVDDLTYDSYDRGSGNGDLNSYDFHVHSVEPLFVCPDGFSTDHRAQTCSDINECSGEGQTVFRCSDGCVNTPGSFACTCLSNGFRLHNSFHCVDIDECKESLDNCDSEQVCQNTVGSHRCVSLCQRGFYMLANGTCVDIDECAWGLGSCGEGTQCLNTPGSYHCKPQCQSGYQYSNFTKGCVDVNECLIGGSCGLGQICVNSPGSYKCICPPGFVSFGPKAPCHDINECMHVPLVCDYACHNTPGSYYCFCPPDYELLPDGHTCTPAAALSNEKVRLRPGQEHAALGCPLGFEWNGFVCEDVDECARDNPCEYSCENMDGSYRCNCPPGYQLGSDQASCQDINECTRDQVRCDGSEVCFNQRGTYQCLRIPCPRGFRFNKMASACEPLCVGNSSASCPQRHWKHSKDARIQIQMVALPKDLPANTNLLRLTAYDSEGRRLHNTRFRILSHHPSQIPFGVRLSGGRGLVYLTRPLTESRSYRLRVRAVSYDKHEPHRVRYQSEFWIYIAVSDYSF